eukprot:TRINITY_DN662_c0_g1_i1.p1 TRINITY_DN662_c0_g1~~TRINITY_DN662_c0_g1_i1.p1  ORF type:complete len:248 (-),score=43.25 TRINITY_DN662_c0_g1_i1:92-835(-)
MTDTILLKCYHGNYLSATPEGKFQTSATIPQSWEKYTREPAPSGTFNLKTAHGKYLCATSDKKLLTADVPKEWERWIFESGPSGTFYLKDYHGKYLSAVTDQTLAFADVPREWERWTVEPTSFAIILRIISGSKLRAEDSNGRSDPYVTIFSGGNSLGRTPHQESTVNPVWGDKTNNSSDYEFKFTTSNKILTLEVKDHDNTIFDKDDFMGKVDIDLSKLDLKSGVYTLTNFNLDTCGTILIGIGRQ